MSATTSEIVYPRGDRHSKPWFKSMARSAAPRLSKRTTTCWALRVQKTERTLNTNMVWKWTFNGAVHIAPCCPDRRTPPQDAVGQWSDLLLPWHGTRVVQLDRHHPTATTSHHVFITTGAQTVQYLKKSAPLWRPKFAAPTLDPVASTAKIVRADQASI